MNHPNIEKDQKVLVIVLARSNLWSMLKNVKRNIPKEKYIVHCYQEAEENSASNWINGNGKAVEIRGIHIL